MQRALGLADRAAGQGEVPVGAILVKDGAAVGDGWNCPITIGDPSAHAEIMALRAAALSLDNYRLPGTTLYVTLEPCVMCAGAIIQARVDRVVYAADDPKAGAAGSVFDVLIAGRMAHRPGCEGGLYAEQSSEKLKHFFRARR